MRMDKIVEYSIVNWDGPHSNLIVDKRDKYKNIEEFTIRKIQ